MDPGLPYQIRIYGCCNIQDYHKALHLGCCSSRRSASAYLVSSQIFLIITERGRRRGREGGERGERERKRERGGGGGGILSGFVFFDIFLTYL